MCIARTRTFLLVEVSKTTQGPLQAIDRTSEATTGDLEELVWDSSFVTANAKNENDAERKEHSSLTSLDHVQKKNYRC